MIAASPEVKPITYPARPMTGGRWGKRALPYPGEWHVEPKVNGWRALVHPRSGTMFNRHGKRLSIASEFEKALSLMDVGAEWLDCEALERRHGIGKGTLIVLDVVTSARMDYEQRRRWMENTFPLMDMDPAKLAENSVVILPSWGAAFAATTVWDELPKHNKGPSSGWFYEGLVAKRLDSFYPIQLQSPDQTVTSWIKYRYKW